MRDSLQDVLGWQYRIVRLLEQTENKKLFLLSHIPTNSLRVAKCIDTYTLSPLECHVEAKILRLLQTSRVPRLHDEIVTDHYYFIIEDYVPGISLEAYVLHQKISLYLFNLICLDLFDLFEYLHNRPIPVYYLDLKPEHIFVRDVGISLVDFGASTIGGALRRCRQATPRFAPPELLKRDYFVCDATADIFGLGRIMHFLAQNMSPDYSDELMKIITKACRFEPDMRYQCVSDMRQAYLKVIHLEN